MVRLGMGESERDKALSYELGEIDRRLLRLEKGQEDDLRIRDRLLVRVNRLEKAFAQIGIAYVTLASASSLAASQARSVGLDFDDPEIREIFRRGLQRADAELEHLKTSRPALIPRTMGEAEDLLANDQAEAEARRIDREIREGPIPKPPMMEGLDK